MPVVQVQNVEGSQIAVGGGRRHGRTEKGEPGAVGEKGPVRRIVGVKAVAAVVATGPQVRMVEHDLGHPGHLPGGRQGVNFRLLQASVIQKRAGARPARAGIPVQKAVGGGHDGHAAALGRQGRRQVAHHVPDAPHLAAGQGAVFGGGE